MTPSAADGPPLTPSETEAETVAPGDADQPAIPAGSTLAAVDLGTNSFHLVVARLLANGRFEVLDTEKEMVRLGSGSGDMKHLEPDAIERGVSCLRRFRQVAEIHGAKLRAVATSAVREAENRDDFLVRCRDEAGVDVEVISGVEEARLIHLGVLQAVPVYDRQLLLVDIGGGSTEFLLGKADEMLWARSLKLGAIRLTERFFADGRSTPKRAARCRDYVRSFLAPSVGEILGHGYEVAVGSSGTIEALVAIAAHRRSATPPVSLNGAIVTRAELDDAVATVLAATPEARGRIPGVDPPRADILPAGALLLQTVVHELGIEQLTFSSYALREGALLDQVSSRSPDGIHHLSDLRRSSVAHLLDRFEEERSHARWSTDLALQLFAQTRDLHNLGDERLDTLEAGGLLANIGRAVAYDAHHKHSYYLIRHSEQLTGFSSREIELIAQVARYHRKSGPKLKHAEHAALHPEDQQAVAILAGLLRLGIGLDRSQRHAIEAVRCHWEADARTLLVVARTTAGVDASLELYAADARKDLLEAALGVRVRIVAA